MWGAQNTASPASRWVSLSTFTGFAWRPVPHVAWPSRPSTGRPKSLVHQLGWGCWVHPFPETPTLGQGTVQPVQGPSAPWWLLLGCPGGHRGALVPTPGMQGCGVCGEAALPAELASEAPTPRGRPLVSRRLLDRASHHGELWLWDWGRGLGRGRGGIFLGPRWCRCSGGLWVPHAQRLSGLKALVPRPSSFGQGPVSLLESRGG